LIKDKRCKLNLPKGVLGFWGFGVLGFWGFVPILFFHGFEKIHGRIK